MKNLGTTIFISFLLIVNHNIFAQTTHIVHASNYTFTPADLTIVQGDTVTWVWDEGTHTTTSDSTTGTDVWDAPLDQNDPTFSFVLTYPGVHHYHCKFHASLGMVGTITVQVPTSVTEENNQTPIKYQLDQNYPNPFNPATEIRYSIGKSGLVQLNVYNILGKRIKSLINQIQSAGNYDVSFNAGNLPSGIYFYKLSTKNYNKTKKMILMK